MAAGFAALASLLLTALTLTSYRHSGRDRSASSASAGRNLTVYAMAVGQGDGNIILCPNGRDVLIVDMGARVSQYASRNYGAYLLKEKFKVVENDMKIHIVITQPAEDHYNFLRESVFQDQDILKQVQEIVIGNKFEEYGKRFQGWIEDTANLPHVYTINNGSECFGNRQCAWTLAYPSRDRPMPLMSSSGEDPWQFCGGDVDITVLGANICVPSKRAASGCADPSNVNVKSVILRLSYNDWSLFLSGDFEGVPHQKRFLAHWSNVPSMLRSTYYKVSRHGAWTEKKANSEEILKAVSPKRAYVSQGHPITTFCRNYIHPRCEVLDNLISLCTIDKIPSENSLICWQDMGKSFGRLERRRGYAIYETCREYDVVNDTLICHDIMISTNGRDDHTSYVSVPNDHVHTQRLSSKGDESCKKGRKILKEQLFKMKNC